MCERQLHCQTEHSVKTWNRQMAKTKKKRNIKKENQPGKKQRMKEWLNEWLNDGMIEWKNVGKKAAVNVNIMASQVVFI